MERARISSVHKNSFSIIGEYGEVTAEVTGKFAFNAETSLDFPAVGDYVDVQYLDNHTFAIILDIKDRKSILKRKTAGRLTDYQVIATNIDDAFIMQSVDANFNINRLERYIVMVREGKITPVILLSKVDLITADELAQKIVLIKERISDIQIFSLSSQTLDGVDVLSQFLSKDKTYCLLGSSGVGKSTLLNTLMGSAIFDTKEVREKDDRGKHTTTRRQMMMLNNGAFIIDTPGMRELGCIDIEQGLADVFDDISALASDCRFNDCTHSNEKGCAVQAAIRDGSLSQAQYDNYLKLKKESDFHKMSYYEKRQKDKKFAKMVNSVMNGAKKA